MKKVICGLIVLFALASFVNAEGIAEEARRGNEKAELSYAFGMLIANDLAGMGFDYNYDSFIRGFREIMENQDTRYTMEEAAGVVQAAYEAVQTRISEHNLAEGTAFLEENGKRPGVVTTSSGLQYEVISEGTGVTPGIADSVTVHYHGTLIDGTVFSSTLEEGSPVTMPLDNLISGWSEGLRMMRAGEKAKIYLPPNLAYGEYGAGGGMIGPNEVLIFEIELISVESPETQEPPPEDIPEEAGL